jgi:hypothetical protein
VTAAADLTTYAASARADAPVDLTKYATAPGVADPDEPVDLTKYAEGTAPAATAGRTGSPDLTKYAEGSAPAVTAGRAGPPDVTKYAEGGGSAGVMAGAAGRT